MFGSFRNRRPPKRSPSSNADIPTSDLWDQIIDMDWQTVISHCQEHPRDAEWTDGHWHETPLYLACQHNPPIEALRAIIQAYPGALQCPTRANKDLPLHVACRYQVDKTLLEELVREFPVTAVEQTRWGRTPLVALWEFRPKQSTIDQAYWEKVLVILNAVARFRQDPQYKDQIPTTRNKQFRGVRKYLQDSDLPKADTSQELSEPKDPLLLHAAVSLGALSCPTPILEYILALYPSQIRELDPFGNLPLHIATGPAAWSQATRRKYRPREGELIERLIRADPSVAAETIVQDHGRYPLHRALANRHTWGGGVESIFLAAPHVVFLQDPLTRLYPFQLAAAPAGEEMAVDLNTIYMLLRSQPDVLSHMDVENLDNKVSLRDVTKRDKKGAFLFPWKKCTCWDLPRFHWCPPKVCETIVGVMIALCIGGTVGVLLGELAKD
eukprot:Nitzschia sp. Nitz4//scaffold161_size51353//13377//14696//NITZ4_006943-RA/size51353-processed-gene-0.58-mRNA-1//1//CDS//3329537894//6865//frame0